MNAGDMFVTQSLQFHHMTRRASQFIERPIMSIITVKRPLRKGTPDTMVDMTARRQYKRSLQRIMDPPDEGDNSRGKWRIDHGRLITTWRFSGESSDSTAVEEIIELTEKIFKSRIISQEGPGRPEGQVLPSEIFTVTRVTTKK
jgi:hypothetical protein